MAAFHVVKTRWITSQVMRFSGTIGKLMRVAFDERSWVNATLATAYGHVTVSCRSLVIELAAPPEWAAAAYRG